MVQPWKLLVYIAADNSLYDDAQVSLQEITSASLFSNVETIVQIDGPNAELSSRYRCSGGSKKLIWEAPDSYSGDRKVRLEDFLAASVDHPVESKRIFLVLWGHGAGLDHVYFYKDPPAAPAAPAAIPTPVPVPVPGTMGVAPAVANAAPNAVARTIQFQPAELLNGNNANRYVDDIALAGVLTNFSKSMNQKIDLLGFDACMMAMVEIWHEIRDSTSLVVASDEELPKGSWPYALILSDLAKYPGMDASTLSTVIVSRFLERYSMQGHRTRVSLSAVDLRGCIPLSLAMRDLVAELTKVAGNGQDRRRMFRARDSSRTSDEVTYIDLGMFCNELSESFADSTGVHITADAVLAVLKQYPYVIYHRDFKENEPVNAYGVALYFPDNLAPTRQDVITFAATHSLTQGKKFPPSAGKFPPSAGKFPPSAGKGVGVSAAGQREISGYEILWDHYQELSFSTVTGWATLIENVLKLGY